MRLRPRGNDGANAGAGVVANAPSNGERHRRSRRTEMKGGADGPDGPAARWALRNVTNERRAVRTSSDPKARSDRKRPRGRGSRRAEGRKRSFPRRRAAAARARADLVPEDPSAAAVAEREVQKHAVGAAVSKEFFDAAIGRERPYEGAVAAYDAAEKLYLVRYDDGDEEELDEAELGRIAVVDSSKNDKPAASRGRGAAARASLVPGSSEPIDVQGCYAVGTAVSKEFFDEGRGGARPFAGAVAAYDAAEGLYLVVYEDGDEEELDEAELGEIAVVPPAVVVVGGGGGDARMEVAIDPSESERGIPFDSSFFAREGRGASDSRADSSTNEHSIALSGAWRNVGDPVGRSVDVAEGMDERDADDPLCVSAYVRDIYEHYRRSERTACVTHRRCTKGQLRAELIDWLIGIHSNMKLEPATLYLMANVVDRYLDATEGAVSGVELRLAGVTALLVAAKYEEIHPPELVDLVRVCGGAYSKLEIVDYEEKVLRTLDYRITVPTAHHFLLRFLKASRCDGGPHAKVARTSSYVLDGTLPSRALRRYLPSQLAAAALFVARRTAGCAAAWGPALAAHAGYAEEDVRSVARDVLGARASAPAARRAVDRKYAGRGHRGVANIRLCSDF